MNRVNIHQEHQHGSSTSDLISRKDSFGIFLFAFYTFTHPHTHIHRLAITLKPLRGEVNNIDYLITVAPVKGWDIISSKSSESVLDVGVLEAGRMGKCKELSDFDMDQIMTAT